MSNRSGKNGNSSKGGSAKINGPKKGGSLLGQKPRGKKADGKVYVRDDAPRRNHARVEEKQLPQTNKRLGEFIIDRLSHDGRGVASLEGKTVFIDGALVGEKVTARLVEDHARFIDARIDQLIDSSPARVAPPCEHFAQCGGCQLQYMQPSAQVAMKQNAVLEQLRRWGGVVPKYVLPAISADDRAYRSRARLGVWYEADGSVTLGFRQRYSNEITPISQCIVLVPELNALLAPLHLWLTELRASKAVTHIELVKGQSEIAIILRHTKKLADADLAALAQLVEQAGCKVWLEPNGNIGLTDLAGQPCDPRLAYQVKGVELLFHPQDFTQVNPQVNQQMVAQALALLALKPTDRVLDLFCGIGNFTLPIAQQCAEVVGIEAIESMVLRGRENAERLQIGNAKFIAANLADMTHTQLQRLGGANKEQGIDAILLDPPRDGAKDIIASILRLGAGIGKQLSPKRIVYVSCNPATLARDSALLAEAGYQLDKLGVLDMFPHTSHVESMALFLR
ncbi:23S rRNA (uracil(1939)-C(5))-methyltransferase RlmD [Cellvibrio sp. OA-2007]|uniref:23S rRNA (uracil(1939)-C(5))-methyltransferase RlmD n=1 Tax=Cellvibrio sp. OA-2007 TaxID=529823 RepID=UPI0009FD0FF6|nr:23S rRNA (uracil(1939)-C(5))-methyltransferase RlmD [Cellvibrio sp. OA-2007]